MKLHSDDKVPLKDDKKKATNGAVKTAPFFFGS
jgi:hypothetical protein